MKEFLLLVLFTVMFFAVSCGSGSKTDDTNDTGSTDIDSEQSDSYETDTVSENDNDLDLQDSDDSTDMSSDGGDSAPDNGDTTTSDDSDSTEPEVDNDADSGDSAPDSDAIDTATANPDNLPQCSPTSATPCFDPETGLIWSGKSLKKMHWNDALNYCNNLNEGGYSDWRLPSITVLKTLVLKCEESNGCEDATDWKYSKLGDIVFLWSSTSDDYSTAGGVYFFNGVAQSHSVDENFDARCVRREGPETRHINCTELPEHAGWNTVSEIDQTWDWDKMWFPPSKGIYSEEASTEWCVFKCEENYFIYLNPVDFTYSLCLNPCDPNPCAAITNSICTALSAKKFSCSGGTDPGTGLTWSEKAPNRMTWLDAKDYCSTYSEGGISGWHLPNIDELKTLLVWSRTDSCKVSEQNNCLSWDECWTCETCTEYADSSPSVNNCLSMGLIGNGKYSKLGDTVNLWSSSTRSDKIEDAWGVYFETAFVNSLEKAHPYGGYDVRCVR